MVASPSPSLRSTCDASPRCTRAHGVRAQVVAGIAHRGFVLLDADDRTARSDCLSQHAREQAGAAEQVERRLAGLAVAGPP